MTKGALFKKTLKKSWFFYLLWALGAAGLSVWLLSIKTAPKANEKVQLLLSGYGYDKTALAAALDGKKPAGIKEISFRFAETDSSSYDLVYDSYGRSSADLLILPNSKINSNKCLYDFQRIKEADASSLFGEVSYYEDGGYTYGIKVYDSLTGEGWADELIAYAKDGVTGEDYYLFFNRGSVNTGILGDKEDAGALYVAQALQSL